MKCPKCGKDVILQKKQVGVDENGNPILNEYAICKDCKKQWNLDKQRAKKAVKKSDSAAEATTSSKQPEPEVSDKKETVSAPKQMRQTSEPTERPKKKRPVSEHSEERPVKKQSSAEHPGDAPRKKRPASEQEHEMPRKKRPASEQEKEAPRKRRPVSESDSEAPRKKRPASEHPDRPKKKAHAETNDVDTQTKVISLPDDIDSEEEPRYANIPSEKVRAKRERAVKQSYEDMLASDPDRKSVHKRKASPKPVEESEDFDEEDDYDYDEEFVTPKFRILRVIFGILSILAFGFFTYKGVISGLDSITSGSNSNIGTFYVIMALCMLISGLLLLILQKRNTIVAFLLPMFFYLGCGVVAFLKRGDDKLLLFSAIACAVLAVIFLILTILSRRDSDEEDEEFDDYDDPFEEDHDNY